MNRLDPCFVVRAVQVGFFLVLLFLAGVARVALQERLPEVPVLVVAGERHYFMRAASTLRTLGSRRPPKLSQGHRR